MPWLGQALEDYPIEWRGSCIRTQEQAQACMQAGQAAVERGEGLIRAAEETRELLRPFHRRHKIERARRDAWALVYVRLEVEGWSEALSEARTNLAAARRAHAQHPGRAGRVRALALADVAVAEMVAGEHTAQSTYDSLLAHDEEGRHNASCGRLALYLLGSQRLIPRQRWPNALAWRHGTPSSGPCVHLLGRARRFLERSRGVGGTTGTHFMSSARPG